MRIVHLAWMFALVVATGCSSYQFRGKVIEGPRPGIYLVNADDARLNAPGLGGATLDLTLDPNSVTEKYLGTHLSDLDGNFAVPIGELGAGMLEYSIELVSRCSGFEATVHTMPLPSKNQRVIVVMREGRDTYRSPRQRLQDDLKAGDDFR